MKIYLDRDYNMAMQAMSSRNVEFGNEKEDRLRKTVLVEKKLVSINQIVGNVGCGG